MRERCGAWLVACTLMVALTTFGPRAATGGDGDGGGGASAMTADQLEKLVAPVALYPDKLLSNVLRAATVPIQIVQADRYLDKKSSGGDGDEAQTKDWDPSVQALLHYPEVVTQMSDKLDWTTELGQAVVAQQKDVTTAVQADRARAAQQGALKSNDQVQVTTEPAPSDGDADDAADADDGADASDAYYSIQTTDPSVIYVPTYDPAPLYPGYRGAGAVVAWGAGLATGAWLAGGFHWDSGDITVNRNLTVNGTRSNVWHHPSSLNHAWRQGAHRPASWQHDGGIGSFGSPRGRAGERGASGRGAHRTGDRNGRFGGGFHGGSASSHFGHFGGDGFGGHGRSAFSGLGGGGFHDHAAQRGGSSREGFGRGGGRGGGFRGGRRR